MALKAGRVGVAPDQVNPRGEIKNAGLTPEQQAKLNRALLTPVTAPLEEILIGIDDGNSEIQVKIGSGLELEGSTSPYTLKAAGGGNSWQVADIHNLTELLALECDEICFSLRGSSSTGWIEILAAYYPKALLTNITGTLFVGLSAINTNTQTGNLRSGAVILNDESISVYMAMGSTQISNPVLTILYR